MYNLTILKELQPRIYFPKTYETIAIVDLKTFDEAYIKAFNNKEKYFYVNGFKMKTKSLRYATFYKQKDCVCCGLKGEFYAIQKNRDEVIFHANLYGLKGIKAILMTKDHIHPRSKGGKDNIDNMQNMCTRCNLLKSDSIEIEKTS